MRDARSRRARGPRTGRTSWLGVGAVAIALAALVGLIVLWPTGASRPETPALSSFEGVYAATVERRVVGACAGAPEARCVRASFRLSEGPDAGRTIEMELPPDAPRAGAIVVGRTVLLGHQPGAQRSEYVFLEPDRRPSLILLAALFAGAVILLGRWRGVTSLMGLAATLAVLFVFIVPAILDGGDPLLVSLVGAAAIAFVALYLSHGPTARTTVALIGTLSGLVCAALLAVLFMGLAEITGFASEEALYLAALGTTVDLRGLILGGMMIGALGAIDDMTVTQAAAVWELHAADRSISGSALTRAGMRIGRDHVASTVNTLVLAYAGASMPLLLLFVLSQQPPSTVASSELVATEIVRTLVGSVGLVVSVPVTTWLAAWVVSDVPGRHVVRPRRAPPDDSGPAAGRLAGELDLGGPEEHPIPEHRWEPLLRRLTRRRTAR